jgi:hypothetical protein
MHSGRTERISAKLSADEVIKLEFSKRRWWNAPSHRRNFLSCTQGGTESQEPAARPARSRLQDHCTAHGAISSGTRYVKWAGGSRLQTHTDGPLWAALLKMTVMCKAWRRCTALFGSSSTSSSRLLGQPQFFLITESSIPIPVPGQYRLSRCQLE